MADQSDVDWDTCAAHGCVGVRLPAGGRCWAHTADDDLDAALEQLAAHGRLDARGVRVTTALLERVLGALPHDDHGCAILTGARFDRAVFQGDASFAGVTFGGEAWFDHATFQSKARFDRATFQRIARFPTVTVHGEARFDFATFQGDAWFDHATFVRDASFPRVTIHGIAGFHQATFRGAARFDHVTFRHDAWFGGATFRRATLFHWVTFQGAAWFGGATFQRAAWFAGATFQRARQLGPMQVRKSLVLDQAVFQERALIEVSAAAVCCRRTRFEAGAQMRVRWAQVVLDDADLAAPSVLAGVPSFPDLDEGRWARAMQRLRAGGTSGPRPRLVSVRRADVAGLTVAGADLRACRFAGAHHLDQLRVEEGDFANTPQDWRWTTRQALAEEHHWRAGRDLEGHGAAAADRPGVIGGAGGWYRPICKPPAWLEAEPPAPAQIAAIYRALRKGREDSKDEPGAADFYYGEMEMRRHDPTKPRAERLVLFLYWLFSGYALRASRALGWLLGVLVMATVVLAAVGLEPPTAAPDWAFPARLGTAALVAVEGAVFRASEQQLTYMGRLIQAVLRVAGPILLGLAVLSIRGRVRR